MVIYLKAKILEQKDLVQIVLPIELVRFGKDFYLK